MTQRNFDVVIFGATGFTGRLVAEYLVSEYGSSIRWAMAGRSADKLASVRDEIGAPADTPLIVADSSDPASLEAMAARTSAVIPDEKPFFSIGLNHFDPASLRYAENIHIWEEKYNSSTIEWLVKSVKLSLVFWSILKQGKILLSFT